MTIRNIWNEIEEVMTDLHALPNTVERLLAEMGKPGWKFKMVPFIKSGTYGLCDYGRKEILVMHEMIVKAPEYGIYTVVHEMGHALSPKNGHGQEWKDTCIALGYDNPQQFNQFLLQMPQRVQRLIYAYRLYYKPLNGEPDELLDTFSNRNYKLTGRFITGRPETRNRLFWLPL